MITIKGIYGRQMYETWYQMSVLLETGVDISPVVTHRYSYEDFEKGFAAIKEGNCGKVILDFESI
jgi:threonine 3-dehydrogenase